MTAPRRKGDRSQREEDRRARAAPWRIDPSLVARVRELADLYDASAATVVETALLLALGQLALTRALYAVRALPEAADYQALVGSPPTARALGEATRAAARLAKVKKARP